MDENRRGTEGGGMQQCSTVRALGKVEMGETKRKRGGREEESVRGTREMVCGCQATIGNQIPKHPAYVVLPSLQA